MNAAKLGIVPSSLKNILLMARACFSQPRQPQVSKLDSRLKLCLAE